MVIHELKASQHHRLTLMIFHAWTNRISEVFRGYSKGIKKLPRLAPKVFDVKNKVNMRSLDAFVYEATFESTIRYVPISAKYNAALVLVVCIASLVGIPAWCMCKQSYCSRNLAVTSNLAKNKVIEH